MSSPYSFGLAFPVAVKVAVNHCHQARSVRVMPGQKSVHEERKTKKPEGTKERTLHAGIFSMFPIRLPNLMNGLLRLAYLICEVHAYPLTSAEIR
jgi:hypothetical protein